MGRFVNISSNKKIGCSIPPPLPPPFQKKNNHTHCFRIFILIHFLLEFFFRSFFVCLFNVSKVGDLRLEMFLLIIIIIVVINVRLCVSSIFLCLKKNNKKQQKTIITKNECS